MSLLTADTENILRANYDAIEHCRQLGEALDGMHDPATAIRNFEAHLKQQQGNVAKEGEQALTNELARNFSALKADPTNLQ